MRGTATAWTRRAPSGIILSRKTSATPHQEAAMKSVEIDRSKRLRDQPTTGHNRFHPDIPPIVVAEEGEEIVLPTRDGVDGQFPFGSSEAVMTTMEAGAIHPLTGPVFVKGAKPGDVLE